MAKFVHFSFQNKYVNVDAISSIGIRECATDDPDAIYEMEIGTRLPTYDIVVRSGGEEFIYETMDMNYLRDLLDVLDMLPWEFLNAYVSFLIGTDFQASFQQFTWLIVGEKSEAEKELLDRSGIIDKISDYYCQNQDYYRECDWMKKLWLQDVDFENIENNYIDIRKRYKQHENEIRNLKQKAQEPKGE